MLELREQNFKVIVLDLTSSSPQICAERRGRGGKSVNAKVWLWRKDQFNVNNLIYLNAC
jgi:hypothetical protein